MTRATSRNMTKPIDVTALLGNVSGGYDRIRVNEWAVPEGSYPLASDYAPTSGYGPQIETLEPLATPVFDNFGPSIQHTGEDHSFATQHTGELESPVAPSANAPPVNVDINQWVPSGVSLGVQSFSPIF